MARALPARTILTMIAVAAAATLVPAAFAQDASTQTEMFISGDAGPLEVAAGASASQSYDVIFTATNFACQGSNGIFVVSVSAEGQPEGVNVTLDQAQLNYTAPSGVQQSVAGGEPAYNETQTVNVEMEASGAGAAEPNFTLAVTASYDGTAPEGCTANGGFPESSASASTQIMVAGGAPPEDILGVGGNETDDAANGNATENGGDSPGATTPILLAATLLAAFAVRARRRA